MSEALRLENFTVGSGSRQILQGISFSLPQGRLLWLLGPNGAGKSSLLRGLLGLPGLRAGGQASIMGQDAARSDARSLARLAAYVPQAAQAPPFSLREFAALSLYARAGAPEPGHPAVSRALAITGMEDLADLPMPSLSGGQLRRAHLAAALAQQTPMLILDEPLASLDPPQARAMSELLVRLNREEGLTVLAATHHLSLALEAGGLALLLRAGRQLGFGPMADLPESGLLEKAFQHQFTYLRHPGDGRTIIAD